MTEKVNVHSSSFDDYEDAALASAVYPSNPRLLTEVGREVALYPFLKLAGETGEVCEKIGKIMRDKESMISEQDVIELSKELGDVLWYITACSMELGVPLRVIAHRNIAKLQDRKQRGKLQGSGDNR